MDNMANIKHTVNILPISPSETMECTARDDRNASSSPDEDKYGRVPIIRVKWDKAKKDFVSERLISETYLNQIAAGHGH
jgi:hypothetical protein